ncbi:MAG: DUF3995 domain-containing protein [Anaerolineae bacterium]|jgi:hypothetical protein|nr:DUF3995 domain-containing protein [Anaerolineae bacterium]MBT7071616.1 DUF3995 domain-containing protein [Anaerolineae bacterium]MBT7326429.1 DUF3995 domain-containing protein [Anaerolineae bacterium]MBT7602506.1 DUF3995 domain-containing protein [Anaerolineae bacterium]
MSLVDFIGITLSIILLSLGTLHIYWALSGTWGISYAVPTTNGKALFKPSSLAKIFVAQAFFTASLIVMGRIGLLIKFIQLPFIFYWGTWGIAAVFLLRTIGEFKYIGFFKRYRTSRFASLDTRFYSPLCLFIAIGAFLVNLFKI